MTRTLSKANRLNEIVAMLRLKPRRVVDLAAHFGVARRTIERDLEDLRHLHEVESEAGRYWIKRRASALNDVEALAVHSATRLLVHTGVGERHYRSSLAKLAEQLPDPARSALVKSMERLTPGSDDRVLDLVAQAWLQGKVLRAKYRSVKGRNWHPHEYEIYFYEINRRNLEPYIVARERLFFEEIRVFKLARMREVRLLNEHYEIPEDFDPHEFLSGSWGIVVGEEVKVRIRAEPGVAHWFHEREGSDSNISIQSEFDDGGLEVVVTGRLAANGDAHELLSFLLGWGANIEVLEPEYIRKRVAEDLATAAARYASG